MTTGVRLCPPCEREEHDACEQRGATEYRCGDAACIDPDTGEWVGLTPDQWRAVRRRRGEVE